jgi:hypothetical protein
MVVPGIAACGGGGGASYCATLRSADHSKILHTAKTPAQALPVFEKVAASAHGRVKKDWNTLIIVLRKAEKATPKPDEVARANQAFKNIQADARSSCGYHLKVPGG